MHGEGLLALERTAAGCGSIPRPAARTCSGRHWFSPIRDALDWLDSAWSNYVVELDCQRQRDAIYQPIARRDGPRGGKRPIRAGGGRCSTRCGMALYLDHLSREVRWLLLGVAAALVLALLLAGRRLAAGPAWPAGSAAGAAGSRLVQAAAAASRSSSTAASRPSWPGRGWFARRANATRVRRRRRAALAARPAKTGWRRCRRVVADAFYRVRFGRTPLDNSRPRR